MTGVSLRSRARERSRESCLEGACSERGGGGGGILLAAASSRIFLASSRRRLFSTIRVNISILSLNRLRPRLKSLRRSFSSSTSPYKRAYSYYTITKSSLLT